ncbi:hypothetical protein ABKV19_008284 [Rosa sericea]
MALSLNSSNPSQQSQNGEIEETHTFKQFDVVSDYSDHHYNTVKKKRKDSKDCFINGNSKVHKHIMKEWRILAKDLPENIYVRVYDTRFDLLRAAIVGAAGTPYHDGLFFFDIKFPHDYPTRPPKVHFRSYGLTLHPHLFPSGIVCLDLLNTHFFGRKWNPSQSTILQVLVSLQGLVLSENPFYNALGNRGKFSGNTKKVSQKSNNNVFVATCQMTLFSLRKTPKNFETFTVDHFRERANEILGACRAYASGRVLVGYYSNVIESCSLSSFPGSAHKVSRKFKQLLKQLYPLLVAEFRMTGASNVVKHLMPPKAKKPNSWKIANWVFNKLEKFLGLKEEENKKKIDTSASDLDTL